MYDDNGTLPTCASALPLICAVNISEYSLDHFVACHPLQEAFWILLPQPFQLEVSVLKSQTHPAFSLEIIPLFVFITVSAVYALYLC